MSVIATMKEAADKLRGQLCGEGELAADLDDAVTVVEKMAAALAATKMLRHLGGMMHGSREVVIVACDAADEALDECRGGA